MNVLFLSLMNIHGLEESNIYTDLLREFYQNGDNVTVISPIEKRFWNLEQKNSTRIKIVNPKVGNITNTPFLEKGISSVFFQNQIINCIKNEIGDAKIDLFIIATPPVNENRIVEFVKKYYNSKVYLLLKDIWPASINDLKLPGGIITKTIVSCFFRRYEVSLYRHVDAIACMSNANVEYVLKHNRYLDIGKVHINPNSITIREISKLTDDERKQVRHQYKIPDNQICFVYGGTLGVGQNVQHIINCLQACAELPCFFLIIGSGVQYHLIDKYLAASKQKNVILLSKLPKEDYLRLMQSCDVGLVFLRYTAQTPNFPSRILSYMEYSMPIFSCTDPVTDINDIIEHGNFGRGCLSNDPEEFKKGVISLCKEDLEIMGKNGRKYMEENYSAKKSFNIIMDWYADSFR